MPNATMAMTPTTTKLAIIHAWFGLEDARLPTCLASCQPPVRVIITRVGMSKTIFGMKRLENSTRAGTLIRPSTGR